MHPAYFETMFFPELPVCDWKKEFAILTAYATTGEKWSAERNQRADEQLKHDLQQMNVRFTRLTGFSPNSGHAEPGWAIRMEFEPACDLGMKYLQDALYYVRGQSLYVSFCDERRQLKYVSDFPSRLATKMT